MKWMIAAVVMLCGFASIVQPAQARGDLAQSERNQCTKRIVFAYTQASSKFELDSALQDIPETCKALFAHGAHLDQFQQEGCNEISQTQMRNLADMSEGFYHSAQYSTPVACQEFAAARSKALSEELAAQQTKAEALKQAELAEASTEEKLVLLNNIKPFYPSQAIRQRHEGVVQVKVTIQPDGHVSNVSISKSSGFFELDTAARETAQRWEFAPISHAEDAVYPVTFDLNHL